MWLNLLYSQDEDVEYSVSPSPQAAESVWCGSSIHSSCHEPIPASSRNISPTRGRAPAALYGPRLYSISDWKDETNRLQKAVSALVWKFLAVHRKWPDKFFSKAMLELNWYSLEEMTITKRPIILLLERKQSIRITQRKNTPSQQHMPKKKKDFHVNNFSRGKNAIVYITTHLLPLKIL